MKQNSIETTGAIATTLAAPQLAMTLKQLQPDMKAATPLQSAESLAQAEFKATFTLKIIRKYHHRRWKKLAFWTKAGKQGALDFFLQHPEVSQYGALKIVYYAWQVCDGYNLASLNRLLAWHKACANLLEINSIFAVDIDSGEFNLMLTSEELNFPIDSSRDEHFLADLIEDDVI